MIVMRRTARRLLIRLSLCLLPSLPLMVAAGNGFTDIDIRRITAAAAAAMPGSISRFDEADWPGCPNTVEDKCTREAVLLIETPHGPRKLIVSNVSDGWIVSQKEQMLQAKARANREQWALERKCDKQWDELTQPGQPYEHWDWPTRWKWWEEHCKIAPAPPLKPIGIDSSLRGGTSSTP